MALITADGGSNSSRVRLWKLELQKLADDLGVLITVCHLPPGTSKWNRHSKSLGPQIRSSRLAAFQRQFGQSGHLARQRRGRAQRRPLRRTPV